MRYAVSAWLALLLLLAVSLVANAEGRPDGTGRIFNNDYLGDKQDRWRSGSYTVSKVWSDSQRYFAQPKLEGFTELRLRNEIISPSNMVRPDPNDRQYAGTLSVGIFRHLRSYNKYTIVELSGGVQLHAVGPSTGVADFQESVHGLGGWETADDLNQLDDAVFPTANVELATSFLLGPAIWARPFLEFQSGIETYSRTGIDVKTGIFNLSQLSLRDETTGQRYRAFMGDGEQEVTFSLGADMTRVHSSELIDESKYSLLDTRTRKRMGVQLGGARRSFFYGITWLGREFGEQYEGQAVGSLNVNILFGG